MKATQATLLLFFYKRSQKYKAMKATQATLCIFTFFLLEEAKSIRLSRLPRLLPFCYLFKLMCSALSLSESLSCVKVSLKSDINSLFGAPISFARYSGMSPSLKMLKLYDNIGDMNFH